MDVFQTLIGILQTWERNESARICRMEFQTLIGILQTQARFWLDVHENEFQTLIGILQTRFVVTTGAGIISRFKPL